MTYFDVTVREVWQRQFRVEARSKAEAIERVESGDGEELRDTFEYDFTLEIDSWDASPTVNVNRTFMEEYEIKRQIIEAGY